MTTTPPPFVPHGLPVVNPNMNPIQGVYSGSGGGFAVPGYGSFPQTQIPVQDLPSTSSRIWQNLTAAQRAQLLSMVGPQSTGTGAPPPTGTPPPVGGGGPPPLPGPGNPPPVAGGGGGVGSGGIGGGGIGGLSTGGLLAGQQGGVGGGSQWFGGLPGGGGLPTGSTGSGASLGGIGDWLNGLFGSGNGSVSSGGITANPGNFNAGQGFGLSGPSIPSLNFDQGGTPPEPNGDQQASNMTEGSMWNPSRAINAGLSGIGLFSGPLGGLLSAIYGGANGLAGLTSQNNEGLLGNVDPTQPGFFQNLGNMIGRQFGPDSMTLAQGTAGNPQQMTSSMGGGGTGNVTDLPGYTPVGVNAPGSNFPAPSFGNMTTASTQPYTQDGQTAQLNFDPAMLTQIISQLDGPQIPTVSYDGQNTSAAPARQGYTGVGYAPGADFMSGFGSQAGGYEGGGSYPGLRNLVR